MLPLILSVIVAQGPIRQANVGTLLLVGATKHSIVIAADSASVTPGNPMRKVQKILPVGKFGACLFEGTTRLQYPINGKITDEVGFVDIAKSWITKHPVAELPYAYDAVGDEMEQAANAFKRRHATDMVSDETHPMMLFVCAGYFMAQAMIYAKDFNAPHTVTDTFHVIDHSSPMKPGYFVALGKSKISDDLTKGNENNPKQNKAIEKYRTARKNKTLDQLTTRDFIELSTECLVATEHVLPSEVAPPNHVAVIEEKSGFQWKQ